MNYWKAVDAPGSPRADISRFHEVPADAVYQNTCAPCHTSQLSFPNGAKRPEDATFREPASTVRCVMARRWIMSNRERDEASRLPGVTEAPIRFSRLSAERYVACARNATRNRRSTTRRPAARSTILPPDARSGRIHWSCRQISHEKRSIEMAVIAQRRSSASLLRGRMFPKGRRDMRVLPRSASVECRVKSELIEVRRGCERDVCAVSQSLGESPGSTRDMRQIRKPAAVSRVICRESWRRCCFRLERMKSTTYRMPR